jgi:hypothetical protein
VFQLQRDVICQLLAQQFLPGLSHSVVKMCHLLLFLKKGIWLRQISMPLNHVRALQQSNPPPRKRVGAQMSPIETCRDIAIRALIFRHVHKDCLLRHARDMTGTPAQSDAGPSHDPAPALVLVVSDVASDVMVTNCEVLEQLFCNMLQGVGPMSGTPYDVTPPNVNALNNRRPHRAKNF